MQSIRGLKNGGSIGRITNTVTLYSSLLLESLLSQPHRFSKVPINVTYKMRFGNNLVRPQITQVERAALLCEGLMWLKNLIESCASFIHISLYSRGSKCDQNVILNVSI